VKGLGPLLVALSLFWATRAYATNIAILRPSGDAPGVMEALFRLQGELLALGLAVKISERPQTPDDAEPAPDGALEQLAAEQKLDAIIDVIGDSEPRAVEIWIVERAARRMRVSQVVLEPNTPNAAETLAIRAIEVLRSNFVEIDLAARARRGEAVAPAVPPTRDVAPKPAPRRTELFGLQAGAAVITGLDGISPAFSPLVRFDWAASSWLVAQATLAAFGTRPTVESEAGSATVARNYGSLGLCYCSPSGPKLRPLVSLSAGAMQTLLDGRAAAPEKGHSLEQWSFLVEGSVGARLRFAERFYTTLAAHVQFATPYVAVHFVDELVATSGRPNLVFSLTVGAWL
jgi:hypothetical protein